MTDSTLFTTLLPDLAVIEISGADAADFLHGQLTHDVSGLAPGQARLAGYCTAKGRLLGSMVIWRGESAETPAIFALVKADIAESLLKRLSMFVLRAKAKLRLTGSRVLGVAQTDALTDMPGPASPWALSHEDAGTWIAAPSADPGIHRWWLVMDESKGEPPAPEGDPALWHAGDITAGLPWIQSATQDLFIPQTLNLDLIDGVSFTKGCYPGQEVVARSHYRGTVKRRMAGGLIASGEGLEADTLAATDTFDANRPDAPCGRIVNAGADRDGLRVLMEVQLGDLAGANFRLGRPDGPVISLQALPYEIESPA